MQCGQPVNLTYLLQLKHMPDGTQLLYNPKVHHKFNGHHSISLVFCVFTIIRHLLGMFRDVNAL